MNAERIFAAVERSVGLMNDSLRDSQTPTLEELADAACISKYHFLRIYQLVTGETCRETMQRLRLARAGTVLAQGGTVTEAALVAGYGSSQALAKALRRSVGQSATQLQDSPGRLAKTIETLGTSRAPGEGPLLAVELASLEPFTIVAVRTQGRYMELAEVYDALAESVGGMENIRNIFGITMNNSEEGLGGDLVFECAFETLATPDPLPAESHLRNVSGGQFLISRHLGCFSRLGESIDSLYWSLLQTQGLYAADQPMFMHYLDDPETTPVEDLRTDIYLPVSAEEHSP